MKEDEIRLYVAATRLPNSGLITLSKLIERHGSPWNVLKRTTSHSELRRLLDSADDIISEVERLGGRTISIACSEYPHLLSEIPDAPQVIYVKGNRPLNIDDSVAVVGTRKCSQTGAQMAGELACELGNMNRPLVSGLAKGIDASAHRTILSIEAPTVAVLAHGLDRIHPFCHKSLAEKIIEKGGVWLTEQPPGTKVLSWMFASRNRILVGLASATIMVESPQKGCSMISAELALNYNRGTFSVVPKDGFSRHTEGNKELILTTKALKLISAQDLEFLLPKASPLTMSRKGVEVDKGDNRPIPPTCKGVLKKV